MQAVPIRPIDEHPRLIVTAGRVVQISRGRSGAAHRARPSGGGAPLYRRGAFGGLGWCRGHGVPRPACTVSSNMAASGIRSNLLAAAAGVPELAEASLESLRHFNLAGLIVGSIAHFSISILVGPLYAVLVPMLAAQGGKWLWAASSLFALDRPPLCFTSPDQLRAGRCHRLAVVCRLPGRVRRGLRLCSFSNPPRSRPCVKLHPGRETVVEAR